MAVDGKETYFRDPPIGKESKLGIILHSDEIGFKATCRIYFIDVSFFLSKFLTKQNLVS